MITTACDSDGALLTVIAPGERDASAMLYERSAGPPLIHLLMTERGVEFDVPFDP